MSSKLLAQAAKLKMLDAAVTGAAGAVSHDARFRVSADHPEVVELDLERIDPNPDQPRRHFDPAALETLAESIRRVGVRQPIGVRKGNGGRYVLIWGERRVRASKLAGKATIFALLTREGDDAELALIENLQREDLDVTETAGGLAALRERHGYTHEQLAAIVGLSKTEITRTLSVLTLPETILAEYPDYRHRVGKSALFELADAGDPARQSRMWEMVKAGGTIAALRSIRKEADTDTDITPDPDPDTKPPAPPLSARRVTTVVRKTALALDTLHEQGATLDDDQRTALQELRCRIDKLLGRVVS
jgi:ParB family chromosome partitioning protein